MSDEPNRPVASRILVVEDEMIVAKALALSLQHLGYHIVGEVSTGEEAIQLAEESKPDLVLMDIKLGGQIDGIQASEEIRVRFDIPIIFLTAHSEADVISRAKIAEPYGFLAKPISHNVLKMTIETVLYKHAADKLVRESEERYRILAENSLAGIYVYQDGKFVYVNQRATEAMGYSEDELIGQSPLVLVAPEDREKVIDIAAARLQGKEAPSQYQFRGLTKTGQVIWAEALVTDIEHNGRPASLGIVQDITDRKRAEEALRESEDRYRQLAEVTFEGIAFHEGGKLVRANQQYYEMFGYSKEELEGQEMLPLTIAPESLETVMRHIENDSTTPYEAIGMKKDGTRFPIEVQARIREINGRKLRVAALRDVSARNESERALRESEAKYRALVETTDTGYVIVDAQGRVLDANAEYVRLTGHATLDEIRGRSMLEWTAEYHRERNSRALEQCIAKGFARNLEIDYADERGCVIPTETSATVIPDAKCGMQIIGLCRDVTYHKVIENRLRASLNEKEVLVREVHHRVKNNLAVIQSLVNLQHTYAKNDGQIAVFENISRRILSMAKAYELLYKSDNLSEVNVIEYIGSLIDDLVDSASDIATLISLKQEIEDVSLKMEILVPLGLIVTELVTNCLKHAFPAGRGGEARVSFRSIGENEFELSVADDGVGLPEWLDLKNPKSLGLDLVRLLSNQLGGAVGVSRVGGTEVRVRFKDDRK